MLLQKTLFTNENFYVHLITKISYELTINHIEGIQAFCIGLYLSF